MTTTTTRTAVEQYLDGRRSDPDRAAADAVLAAAALRLADVLDSADNATSAANASRELRQVMALLAPPASTADEFAALAAELHAAVEPGPVAAY